MKLAALEFDISLIQHNEMNRKKNGICHVKQDETHRI